MERFKTFKDNPILPDYEIKKLKERSVILMLNDNLFVEQMAEYCDAIRKDVPDCGKYFLFHSVIGSTPNPQKSPVMTDIPGYSLVEFINSSPAGRAGIIASLDNKVA